MATEQIQFGSKEVRNFLCGVTGSECGKQLYSFANIIIRMLVSGGVAEDKAKKLIKAALTEHATQRSFYNKQCMELVASTVEDFLNAKDGGRDVLGRLLKAFCFLAPESRYSVPPQGSEAYDTSISEFVPGIIPGPLVDYFLISIRGSVEEFDAFRALPFLFGTNMTHIEELTAEMDDILRDYVIGDMDEQGESAPIYWQGVLLDKRTQMVALRLATEVHERIMNMGVERYLMAIESLQRKQRSNTGVVIMQRLFTEKDIEQLVAALADARERLENAHQRCVLPSADAQKQNKAQDHPSPKE